MRLHNLRYGAASLAHSAGAGLKTVQEQLGHTSIVPTADTYTASCSSTTVIVRMPAYFAEHLAPVLASWTTIGELVSKLSYDESRMSEALTFAANAANEGDESSPELLLQRVRDLLAECRMAVQRSDQDADGNAD